MCFCLCVDVFALRGLTPCCGGAINTGMGGRVGCARAFSVLPHFTSIRPVDKCIVVVSFVKSAQKDNTVPDICCLQNKKLLLL